MKPVFDVFLGEVCMCVWEGAWGVGGGLCEVNNPGKSDCVISECS